MSLFKKIVSSVCAISMIASLAITTVTVEAASNNAMLKAELTSYDNTTGDGVITVSLTNVSAIIDKYDAGCANIASTALDLVFSSSDFNVSMYGKMPPAAPAYTSTLTKLGSYAGNAVPAPYEDGKVVATTNTMSLTSDSTLYTFKFKVLDVTKDNFIEISNAYIDANTWDPANNYAQSLVTYSVENGTLDATTSIKIPSNKPDEPELYDENGKVYDTDGDTVFADGANDNAVAYVKSLSGVQGSKVSFAGTFTKANGDTVAMKLKAPKSLDAVIETAGDVVLGLIVQFGAEYTDFALDADSIVIE